MSELSETTLSKHKGINKIMADSKANTVDSDQMQDFAHNGEDVKAGKPIFGVLTGILDEGDKLKKDISFKNRTPLQRLQNILNLPEGDYTLTTGHDGEYQISFRINAEPAPQEPKTEINLPQHRATPQDTSRRQPSRQPEQPGMEEYYRSRCVRLEDQLNDADRKNRELTDELLQVKRELSSDKTKILLEHQQKLTTAREEYRDKLDELKDNHRKEVRSFESEIQELEKKQLKMELSNKSGQDLSNRIMDALEENAPQVIQVLMSLTQQGQGPGGSGGGQPPQGKQPAPPPQKIPTVEDVQQQFPGMDKAEAQKVVADIKKEIEKKRQAQAPQGQPKQTNTPDSEKAAQPEKKEGEDSPNPHPSLSLQQPKDENPELTNSIMQGEHRNGHEPKVEV